MMSEAIIPMREAIIGHQGQSEAIRRNQAQSGAIRLISSGRMRGRVTYAWQR